MKQVLMAGLMMAVVQSVVAEDQLDNPAFSACMEQAGGVTNAMIECMGAETARQDVLLNQAYQAVMGGLTPERKRQLQEAQRLWLKYRKANCDFYYDPDGGSMARVSANDCFMAMTAARAKELEGFKLQD
ncbi:MAG: lysozyme inhibitor LprI family protein [Methylobacter sp.]|jgi:uncharacterized protein YecT (DUF1311 family)|nr:lysozyme inhibitor LprI family protein [Methylobacter sp.]